MALYGNTLYKNHAEKQIKLINESTPDVTERENLYVKKGGTSWLSVLFAILIIVFVYAIPSFFIPMNTNSIEEVQYTILEYTQNEQEQEIELATMFDSIFDHEKWDYTDKSALGKEYVTFKGEHNEAGSTSDFIINFRVQDDLDYVEITDFIVDGKSYISMMNLKSMTIYYIYMIKKIS